MYLNVETGTMKRKKVLLLSFIFPLLYKSPYEKSCVLAFGTGKVEKKKIDTVFKFTKVMGRSKRKKHKEKMRISKCP